MNLNVYLRRLGIDGNGLEPTLENLEQLQLAHISTVPFENLDLIAGKKRKLDLESIYHNVVVANRGGICCEVNGLYVWLLRQLKFNVKVVQSQPYLIDLDIFSHPKSHLVPLVELEDGRIFISDVAFGKHACVSPVLLSGNMEQSQSNGTYRLRRVDPDDATVLLLEEKWLDSVDEDGKVTKASEGNQHWWGGKHRADGWNILYKLTLGTYYELEDFRPEFNGFRDDEDSYFLHNSFTSMHSNGRTYSLWGSTFTEVTFRCSDNGLLQRRTKTLVGDHVMCDVIKERFGFSPPKNFAPVSRNVAD